MANSKISNPTPISIRTLTNVTTSSSGNIAAGLSASWIYILSAWALGNNDYIILPYRSSTNDTWILHVTTLSGQPVANTQIDAVEYACFTMQQPHAENGMATSKILFEANFTTARGIVGPIDMNDITTAGLYRCGATTDVANWPPTDGFMFFAVLVASQTTMMQIVFGGRVSSEAGRRSFIRYMNNGTWGPWVNYQGVAV